jgi:hypothetical protein
LNRHFKAVFPRPRALRTGGHKKEYTLGNRMSLGSGPRPLGARRSDQNSRANAQAVLIPVFPPLFQTFARRYSEVSRLRRDPSALSLHLRSLGFHLVFAVLLNNPSPKEAQRSRGSPIRPNSRCIPAWVLQRVWRDAISRMGGIRGVRGAPAPPLVLSKSRNPPNRCSDWLHCTLGKGRSKRN